MTTRKTYSLDKNVVIDFDAICFKNAINQSQLIGMLIETYLLKGNEIFEGIIWSPLEKAKLTILNGD